MIKKPQIKIGFEDELIKVIHLEGEEGDVLPEHKVSHRALLYVINGNVTYTEDGKIAKLETGDYNPIPKNVLHKLEFNAASKVLLILVPKSKIKFAHK